MGHEMLRARAGEPTRLFEIVQVAFGPLHTALNAALAEGMASGELRATDPNGLILSLTGANVFYFISAPVFRSISGKDPRDPERLARQRVNLLEFAATVLFADPEHGRALARRIHSERSGPRTAQGEPA
jgi:TetR/AcrR family transcriptional regulator